jgi:oligopeptidase B
VLLQGNTFADFAACAEHLCTQRYTASHLLTAHVNSAGGLIGGVMANTRYAHTAEPIVAY